MEIHPKPLHQARAHNSIDRRASQFDYSVSDEPMKTLSVDKATFEESSTAL